MAESTPQVVRTYLAQLDSALQGVSDDVHRDILAGVREQLDGVDARTAAARIEELGDPTFIAAEARAEAPAQAAPATSTAAIVVIALLVAFGGIVVPVIGWAVGIVWMWMSHGWLRWEKLVATLAIPVAVLVVAGVGAVVAAVSPSTNMGPIILVGFVPWHSLVLVGIALNVVVGAWLLWRGLRRSRTR